MKVVKIVFWPYHCVEEEETKPLLKTASKSDVGNLRTRHHAPERRLPTRPDARHASHASSSPWWADPTRIPDDPTHVPDPDKDDVIMTPVYTVSVQSARHVINVGPTCHVTSREPSWAEPSWSRAASRGIRFCAAESTCNRIWDWIWTAHQARIVLIKS